MSYIKFAISSHVALEKTTIPVLINSLIKAGVEHKNILVVVGGCKQNKVTYSNNIETHYVEHNSYDHTALIEIVEQKLQSEYWFLLHDTCKVGPDFLKNILEFGFEYDHVDLDKDGWLNIGLLSQRFINEIGNYVITLKNCSKIRAILSEKTYRHLTTLSHGIYQQDANIYIPPQDVYNDGNKRHILYFSSIDLYKYQSLEGRKVLHTNIRRNANNSLFGFKPFEIDIDMSMNDCDFLNENQNFNHAVHNDSVLDTNTNILYGCLSDIYLKLPPLSIECDTCICLTTSQEYLNMTENCLNSLFLNGNVSNEKIIIFSFDTNGKTRELASKYNAIIIECFSNVSNNFVLKTIMYSAAHVIKANKYILIDSDIIINKPIDNLINLMNVLNEGISLAVKEENTTNIQNAILNIYEGSLDDLDYLKLNNEEKQSEMVINGGVLLFDRINMIKLDQAIRDMNPQATIWEQNFDKTYIPWREQAILNIALLKMKGLSLIKNDFNYQLLHKEYDDKTIIHINGKETKEQYNYLLNEYIDKYTGNNIEYKHKYGLYNYYFMENEIQKYKSIGIIGEDNTFENDLFSKYCNVFSFGKSNIDKPNITIYNNDPVLYLNKYHNELSHIDAWFISTFGIDKMVNLYIAILTDKYSDKNIYIHDTKNRFCNINSILTHLEDKCVIDRVYDDIYKIKVKNT